MFKLQVWVTLEDPQLVQLGSGKVVILHETHSTFPTTAAETEQVMSISYPFLFILRPFKNTGKLVHVGGGNKIYQPFFSSTAALLLNC
jgi:hypothetical protein